MNKQITEDYVSYEIAQLLKEKKFSWKCNTAYLEFEDGRVELRYEDKAFYQEQTKRRYCVPALLAPSLYNTMKWLREIHNRHISIEHSYILNKYKIYITKYNPDNISDLNNTLYFSADYDFSTYEEACEAAIKYCLKNLI